MHSVYSYETYDSSIVDEIESDFYLVNTVIQEAGHISSIEIYGHTQGAITLSVKKNQISLNWIDLRNIVKITVYYKDHEAG